MPHCKVPSQRVSTPKPDRKYATYFHSVASATLWFLHGTSCLASSTRKLVWTGNNFSQEANVSARQPAAAAPLSGCTDEMNQKLLGRRSVDGNTPRTRLKSFIKCLLRPPVVKPPWFALLFSEFWPKCSWLRYLSSTTSWHEMIDGTVNVDLAPLQHLVAKRCDNTLKNETPGRNHYNLAQDFFFSFCF